MPVLVPQKKKSARLPRVECRSIRTTNVLAGNPLMTAVILIVFKRMKMKHCTNYVNRTTANMSAMSNQTSKKPPRKGGFFLLRMSAIILE